MGITRSDYIPEELGSLPAGGSEQRLGLSRETADRLLHRLYQFLLPAAPAPLPSGQQKGLLQVFKLVVFLDEAEGACEPVEDLPVRLPIDFHHPLEDAEPGAVEGLVISDTSGNIIVASSVGYTLSKDPAVIVDDQRLRCRRSEVDPHVVSHFPFPPDLFCSSICR